MRAREWGFEGRLQDGLGYLWRSEVYFGRLTWQEIELRWGFQIRISRGQVKGWGIVRMGGGAAKGVSLGPEGGEAIS